MIPAAFSALLNGDLENFEVATTPGGVDTQNLRGQLDFHDSPIMPIKFDEGSREDFEKLGFVFGEQVDDLFIKAKLPDGWHKKRTGSTLWTDLLDGQGRERACVFYKAAFYDRDAFACLYTRYKADWAKGAAVDWDGSVLWRSGPLQAKPVDSNRAERSAWYLNRKEQLRQAEDWLDEHKPGWRDPLAYWD